MGSGRGHDTILAASLKVYNPGVSGHGKFTAEEWEDYKRHRRFDRFTRLVGDAAMNKLAGSHVMVIGLGGVGSWAAESLCRSGVGTLSLVDFDRVCVTNANRQLHALTSCVGRLKAEVLAERLTQINPEARVIPVPRFYNAESEAEVFKEIPDFVIDAIDNVTAKCRLLTFCRQEEISAVCSTGSGGRLDPTLVRVADLSRTEVDPLAAAVRKILRQKHGFPRKGDFGLTAVYSAEEPTLPIPPAYDKGKGFVCVCPHADNPHHTCEERSVIMGTASFVTGAMGFACASVAVRRLIQ
ncbi:MAG: tRNA threonylcarbamoyladenosine dehydratase [Elusimicrobia bacterium]|nr:tRNA threonylcarbamoyladenosine dehydratase [Elusimicrobiota bacterium]